MTEQKDPATLLAQLLARTPEWARHDLGSKDPALRQRAEEAMAAMIAAALKDALETFTA